MMLLTRPALHGSRPSSTDREKIGFSPRALLRPSSRFIIVIERGESEIVKHSGNEWGWTKHCFVDATQGFVDLVNTVTPDLWNAPALGGWTVRDLVGHTTRALMTIENYLHVDGSRVTPTLDDPAAYFLAVAARFNPESVAERGRAAGQALGADVPTAVTTVAERVVKLVNHHGSEASVSAPVGVMMLRDYLPSRTFELSVHSLDLARATQQSAPDTEAALDTSLALAAEIASRSGHTVDVLLALTGRQTLPASFSLV